MRQLNAVVRPKPVDRVSTAMSCIQAGWELNSRALSMLPTYLGDTTVLHTCLTQCRKAYEMEDGKLQDDYSSHNGSGKPQHLFPLTRESKLDGRTNQGGQPQGASRGASITARIRPSWNSHVGGFGEWRTAAGGQSDLGMETPDPTIRLTESMWRRSWRDGGSG